MSKKSKSSKDVLKEAENKSDRFVRIVTPRVTKAVKSIHLICNCAGSGYDYTPEQVEQITHVLYDAINRVVDAYTKRVNKQKDFGFKK